ncbi:MAG: AAA family ATPase [Treponema sp.]|nr:AAA family ATPase [Treponema sp.]
MTIDLDPQSSLSEIQVSNFLSKSLASLADDETLNYAFDLYMARIKKYPSLRISFPKRLVHKCDEYDFIPSSLFYRKGIGLDVLAMKMQPNLAYLSILKCFLDELSSDYEYILIDCPPSNNVITQSAFLTSDYYVIPTILDHLSTNGVIHYIKVVESIYSDYCENDKNADSLLAKGIFGNKAKLLGIFYNLIRANVNYVEEEKQFLEELKSGFTDNDKMPYVLESYANNFIDISRDTANGNSSRYRRDFEEIGEELLKRIEEFEND